MKTGFVCFGLLAATYALAAYGPQLPAAALNPPATIQPATTKQNSVSTDQSTPPQSPGGAAPSPSFMHRFVNEKLGLTAEEKKAVLAASTLWQAKFPIPMCSSQETAREYHAAVKAKDLFKEETICGEMTVPNGTTLKLEKAYGDATAFVSNADDQRFWTWLPGLAPANMPDASADVITAILLDRGIMNPWSLKPEGK
jgi:hypothetical protein